MTDRNESNELNEQELEQAAGGVSFSDLSASRRGVSRLFDNDYVLYRCPKCGATKKVKGPGGILAAMCEKCFTQMVKA